MIDRRTILKMLPITALVPTTAKSIDELEKKLNDVKGKYLILADPYYITTGQVNDFSLSIDWELWFVPKLGSPIQIYKLE